MATDVTLNGAQITAAVQVIEKLREGILVPIAAVELLVAVGIQRDKAQQMVNAITAAGPMPTPAPTALTEPAAAKA